MKLTKAQFGYLKWIAREGGVATLERGGVACGGTRSSNASAISFLNLVAKGALEGKDGKLVITEYGRRCLSPFPEPHIPAPGACPAPIGGKTTAAECIAAGQCGCDNRPADDSTGGSHG